MSDRRDADAVLDEARGLAGQALAVARGSDPAIPLGLYNRARALLARLGPSDTLADILRWKGNVLRDSGAFAHAQDYYAQSLAIADATFYTIGRAHALNCFGTMEQCRGDITRAVSWYHSAKRLVDGLGDSRLLGMIEQNLGIAWATSGKPQEALAHFRTAVAHFEQSRDDQLRLWVLNNLGNLYTRERSYDKAEDALLNALHLSRALRDVVSEGIIEENRARLLLVTGRTNEAEAAAKHALELASLRRDPTRQAAALCAHTLIMRERGAESRDILVVLDRALELAQTGGDAETTSEIMREIAASCDDCGDHARADSFRQSARDLESEGLAARPTCKPAPEPAPPP